jgi:hypothetical protein
VPPGGNIGNRFDPWREIRRRGLQTATQIVDHYLDVLVDGDAPAAVRTALINYMNTNDAGPDPFQLTEDRVQRKVRGLAHLIMTLPEFQMN